MIQINLKDKRGNTKTRKYEKVKKSAEFIRLYYRCPFSLPYLEILGSNSTANMTVANSKAVAPLAAVHLLPQIVIFFCASL